jgi:NAD(P)-dependent dehydrogenase (short-subunit alcohol dehydrogenase family)
MNVNLRHQFFAAQAVLPHMRELGQGSIVNFSSTAWMFGGADFVAYSTAKSAVVGLTNALARSFGPDDIRVNAIAPGADIPSGSCASGTRRNRRTILPAGSSCATGSLPTSSPA